MIETIFLKPLSIHHFLIHISDIDKIIDVRSNQFRKDIIGENITSVDLRQFRRIRNHLEHFDERLDNWIKDYEGHAFFDMNFITGTKGFPQKAFLRALDGMVLKFQGEDYGLESVWKSKLEDDIKKIKAQAHNRVDG